MTKVSAVPGQGLEWMHTLQQAGPNTKKHSLNTQGKGWKEKKHRGVRSTAKRGQSHLSWIMHECPYQHSTLLPRESKASLDCMCPTQGIYLLVSILHSAATCISLTSSYPSLQNKHNSHGTEISPSPTHTISSYENSDPLSLSLLLDHPPSGGFTSILFLFQQFDFNIAVYLIPHRILEYFMTVNEMNIHNKICKYYLKANGRFQIPYKIL